MRLLVQHEIITTEINGANSMSTKDRILKAVFAAVDEINQQLQKGQRVDKCIKSVLYGGSKGFDSQQLISFIVDVEQKMEEEFNIEINLTDGDILEKHNSPFENIGSLVDYISDILKEKKNV